MTAEVDRNKPAPLTGCCALAAYATRSVDVGSSVSESRPLLSLETEFERCPTKLPHGYSTTVIPRTTYNILFWYINYNYYSTIVLTVMVVFPCECRLCVYIAMYGSCSMNRAAVQIKHKWRIFNSDKSRVPTVHPQLLHKSPSRCQTTSYARRLVMEYICCVGSQRRRSLSKVWGGDWTNGNKMVTVFGLHRVRLLIQSLVRRHIHTSELLHNCACACLKRASGSAVITSYRFCTESD